MARPSIPAWMFDHPRPTPKMVNPYDCTICGGSVIGAPRTNPRPTHAECIEEIREADAIRTRIEAETVAAIVAWLRDSPNGDDHDRAECIERGDWKRGGHG